MTHHLTVDCDGTHTERPACSHADCLDRWYAAARDEQRLRDWENDRQERCEEGE